MSKASKQQAAENRSRVVAAASALFRQYGLDGVGIREVMAGAGLTQGGFAAQFGSKDQLAAEACAHAFEGAERAWRSAGFGHAGGKLKDLVQSYFSPKPPAQDCPMPTLSGDVARAPAGAPVRAAFTAGLRGLAQVMIDEGPADDALTVLAAMVGAAVLRRASDDPALSDAIDAAVLRLASAPLTSYMTGDM